MYKYAYTGRNGMESSNIQCIVQVEDVMRIIHFTSLPSTTVWFTAIPFLCWWGWTFWFRSSSIGRHWCHFGVVFLAFLSFRHSDLLSKIAFLFVGRLFLVAAFGFCILVFFRQHLLFFPIFLFLLSVLGITLLAISESWSYNCWQRTNGKDKHKTIDPHQYNAHHCLIVLPLHVPTQSGSTVLIWKDFKISKKNNN